MSSITRCSRLVGAVILLLSPLTTDAQSFLPTGTFGSVPFGVNFGGSGIPGPVMTREVGSIGPRLTLGASPRYDNAPLTNDGAGTYFYVPGADACTLSAHPSCPTSGFARWNFNYAITGDDIQSYEYRLWYAITPVGSVDHQWLEFQPGAVYPMFTIPLQNSLNLGMPSLDQIPGAPNFNPNTAGTYRFALIAYTAGTDIERARVAIALTTVPEPSSFALVGLGAVALLFAARRRGALRR